MTLLFATLLKLTGITHCDSDLALAFASPSPFAPVPAPVFSCARHPCLAGFLSGPATLVPDVHLGLPLAVTAAYDLEFPDAPVVEKLGLASERLDPSIAVTVSAKQLDYPAVCRFSLGTFPVLPAEQAVFSLPAPDSVAALRVHAAGNGNSAVEAFAAAPLVGDTDPLNILADR
jgi:hypothetical protein